jgi:hypothetical protein
MSDIAACTEQTEKSILRTRDVCMQVVIGHPATEIGWMAGTTQKSRIKLQSRMVNAHALNFPVFFNESMMQKDGCMQARDSKPSTQHACDWSCQDLSTLFQTCADVQYLSECLEMVFVHMQPSKERKATTYKKRLKKLFDSIMHDFSVYTMKAAYMMN